MTTPSNTYPIDTQLQLSVNFVAVAGYVAVDPSDVKLYLRDPTGALTTYTFLNGQVQKASVGSYFYLVTPAISGVWTYKFQGIGAVVATNPDQTFTVSSSVLIPG